MDAAKAEMIKPAWMKERDLAGHALEDKAVIIEKDRFDNNLEARPFHTFA